MSQSPLTLEQRLRDNEKFIRTRFDRQVWYDFIERKIVNRGIARLIDRIEMMEHWSWERW